MLDKLFIILAAWVPLSMLVALLVGWASKFREPHSLGFTPSVWTESDFAEVSELEADDKFAYLSTSTQ